MTEPATIPAAPLPMPASTRPRAENPYWVYLAQFSGLSQRTMQRCLDRIAAIIAGQDPAAAAADLGAAFPWEKITYAYATLLRTKITEQWPSPSTANKHLSALRGVLAEAWRLGLMAAGDYQRAKEIKNVPGHREPAGRSIHGDEITALLGACAADQNEPLGIRDAAIFAVLQSTGIRRAELASAQVERYDHGERALRVIGKGNKERTVFIHPTAVSYLDRWLVTLGCRRGPMFRRVDRWGHIGDNAITGSAVGYIISGRREQAGLPRLSTHDFRRTFVGDFIDAGGDLVQAQKLAGHATPTTTAAYDRRPARAARAAVDRLSLPSPDRVQKSRRA